MREETLTLWRRADARKGWCEAMRDCLVKVAVARDADVSVYSWQKRIDQCAAIKAACEADIFEKMRREIDLDPADQWMRDAFGK